VRLTTRGKKPADRPVERATNLKTTKTIDIEMPTSLQLRADPVIE